MAGPNRFPLDSSASRALLTSPERRARVAVVVPRFSSPASLHRFIRSSMASPSPVSLRRFPRASLAASLRLPAMRRWCSLSATRPPSPRHMSAARLCHLLLSSSLPVSRNLLLTSSFRAKTPFPSYRSPGGSDSRSPRETSWRSTHSIPITSLSFWESPRIMSVLMRFTVGGVASSEAGTPEASRSESSLSTLSFPSAVRKYTLRLTLQLDPFMRDCPIVTSPLFSMRRSTVQAWARVMPAAAATPS
ncbi:MAG: hypothetical protein IKH98_08335 [Candidatus Methanomethylophilaceae archaeon]|nr:hypothetical protein [Candidatus Methanomethylophilaceae archaeon]